MSIWKNEYLRYKYFWATIFGIEFLLDILHILHILPMVEGGRYDLFNMANAIMGRNCISDNL